MSEDNIAEHREGVGVPGSAFEIAGKRARLEPLERLAREADERDAEITTLMEHRRGGFVKEISRSPSKSMYKEMGCKIPAL